MSGLVIGDDGHVRCPWGDRPPDMRRYHDDEWAVPVRGRNQLFERITLEAFQSGLSWLTVLRKRDRFREVFAGFDPEMVAAFDETDVLRLLGDAGIVRNRSKIEATLANARAVLALDVELGELLWSFAPPPRPHRLLRVADIPAETAESRALSKALRSRGFRFVGPTVVYAFMQAVGMVDDHLEGCEIRVAPR